MSSDILNVILFFKHKRCYIVLFYMHNLTVTILFRFHVDEMDNTNNFEWNKKRKSQTNQLDLPRPKHKCWIGNSSSENDLMLDENPVFESNRTEAESVDDSSGPESAKDSNSFIEDSSNTTMSINEECKLEADSANTCSLNALENHEEHFLGLGNCTDKMFSEYAKDNIEECIDKELEDIYHSKLENPNTYVLSSGRWKVDQGIHLSQKNTLYHYCLM